MRRVRAVSFGLAAVLAAGALALVLKGAIASGLWVLLEAAILAVAVVFEQAVYKPLERRPDTGWSPTPERFVDPSSGRMVRVYARKGERKYVAEDLPAQDQEPGGAGS